MNRIVSACGLDLSLPYVARQKTMNAALQTTSSIMAGLRLAMSLSIESDGAMGALLMPKRQLTTPRDTPTTSPTTMLTSTAPLPPPLMIAKPPTLPCTPNIAIEQTSVEANTSATPAERLRLATDVEIAAANARASETPTCFGWGLP